MTSRTAPAPAPTASSTAAPASPASARFRVPGLDGLRALAVAVVIVFHLSPGALTGGYLGVDVFFLISGFIITALLLREHESTGRIALGGFWLRRARRLLPALVLLLLVCCAAAWAIGGDVLVGLSTQVLGAATFSSNWLLLLEGSSYFDDTVPELFRNLWSLAVEEQFYVVWPLVILALLLLRRRTRALVILAIAIASAVAMAVIADPFDGTRVYYGTDTHSFGLALGALLAVGAQRWPTEATGWSARTRRLAAPAGFVAVAGILALSVVMPEEEPIVFRGGLVGVALLSAVAIAALLVPGSPLARVLELTPMRWIGVRSYGLYLWHWPVFVLLGAAAPTWPREGWQAWMLGGVALLVTVAASALSYRFIEDPIRRDGFRASLARFVGWARSARRTALAGFAAVALLVGLGTGGTLGVLADPGLGQTQQQIEAGQQAVDEAERSDPTPTAAAPEPVTGDQMVAVGDSVTLAAATELQANFPGIRIDAAVSRQMTSAPEIIRALKDSGAMRPVLVLALGTNGPIDRETLEEVRAMLDPDQQIIVVNVQAPRGWTPGVNQTLSSFAADYRDVEMSNWHDAAQPYLADLNSDQVHFGPTGARVWTAALKDALQRLAELPPLRDDPRFQTEPRPA